MLSLPTCLGKFEGSFSCQLSGGRDCGRDKRHAAGDCKFTLHFKISTFFLFFTSHIFAVLGLLCERSGREGGEAERGSGQHSASGASQVWIEVEFICP